MYKTKRSQSHELKSVRQWATRNLQQFPAMKPIEGNDRNRRQKVDAQHVQRRSSRDNTNFKTVEVNQQEDTHHSSSMFVQKENKSKRETKRKMRLFFLLCSFLCFCCLLSLFYFVFVAWIRDCVGLFFVCSMFVFLRFVFTFVALSLCPSCLLRGEPRVRWNCRKGSHDGKAIQSFFVSLVEPCSFGHRSSGGCKFCPEP